jgi:hypothetical protein
MRLIRLLDKYTQPNRLDFFIIIIGNFFNSLGAVIFGMGILVSTLIVISETTWNITLQNGFMLIIGFIYLYFGKIAYANARIIQRIRNK